MPALHALPAIGEALGELAGPRRALSLAVRAGVQEEAFRALPHPCPAQNAWCSGHCAAPPAQPESIGARAAGPEADGLAGTSFAAQGSRSSGRASGGLPAGRGEGTLLWPGEL